MVVLNPGDKSWGNDASGLGRGIGPIRVAWLKHLSTDFNRFETPHESLVDHLTKISHPTRP